MHVLAMSAVTGWLLLFTLFSLLVHCAANTVEKVAKDENVKKAAKDGLVNLLHRWLK
jgi:hypothetical protein